MSSLWTPGGERPVPREPSEREPEPSERKTAPERNELPVDEVELQAHLAELREQLADTPVSGIVAQFAYQLFEVGALHLSVQPPQLDEAQLAIDAMAALVDGLGPRVGEAEQHLREGLSQIRIAFVQVKTQGESPPSGPTDQAQPQN